MLLTPALLALLALLVVVLASSVRPHTLVA
jgi:hypothetical protein